MFNSGIRGRRAKDNEGITNPQSKFIQNSYPQPSITGYAISGVDDTALDLAGGQTVLVNGAGFAVGVSATLGGSQIGAVTLVSPTQISFTAPALSAGTYSLVVYNSSGGAAILVPGITYSSLPTYTTAAGTIGSVYETKSISTSVVATSDSSITYSLASGTLPTGATLSSSGTITGTAPADSGSTTYTFAITAVDAELQDVTRTFTLTVNTDVVTWVTPSSGATINLDGTLYSQALTATDAASYAVSYTANALPTGLMLSSGTISGTPTVEGTTTTLLTATAATSARTATNTITWVVALTDAFFKYTTMLLSANAQSTFITDASLNNLQLTTVGTVRADNFNPYQSGYYGVQFNGSTDGVKVAAGALIGTGPFTISAWIYPTVAQTGIIESNSFWDGGNASGHRLMMNSSRQIRLDAATTAYNTYPTVFTTTNTVVLNTWSHIVVSRDASNNLYCFINGVVAYSGTYSLSLSLTTNPLNTPLYGIAAQGLAAQGTRIGCHGPSDTTANQVYFAGYIADVNINATACLYSAAFTSPSVPSSLSGAAIATARTAYLADASTNQYVTSAFGSPKISSAHPFSTVYQSGTQNYSYAFDGTSDYITSSNYNLNLNGDFTIECWVYNKTIDGGYRMILTGDAGSTYLGITNALIDLNIGTDTNYNTGGVQFIYANTWHHIAVCRSGTTMKIFLDGVSKTISTGSTNSGLGFTASPLTIGGWASGSTQSVNGYISNLRVVKGTALYSSNFTPSTTPLTAISGTSLLTCQDNVFKDNSSNNATFTNTGNSIPVAVSPFTPSAYTSNTITTFGSGYFAGTTSDYLTVPNNPGLQFGTGDFTVEYWVNFSSLTVATSQIPLSCWLSNNGYELYYKGSSGFAWYYMASTLTTSITPTVGQWYHLAVTRSSGTTRIFINGVIANSVSNDTSNLTPTPAMYLGVEGGTTAPFNGYMSDVRVTKGTALYTSNFVPPINSQLTAVANTQLLTLQNNTNTNNSGFKDESSFGNIITRAGNVTNGTFSPYGDNWSNYFDGTGDYVSVPANALFAFGTGDFTIEAWINYTGTLSGNLVPIVQSDAVGSSTNNKWFFAFNNTNLYFNTHASGGFTNAVGFSPTVGTWYHVSVTRTSGAIKMFVGGESKTVTTTGTPSGYSLSQNGLVVGGMSTPYYMTGYISNCRVITGSSLYNASFTPSTTPLTAIANTSLLTCQSNRLIDNSPNNFTITKAGDVSVQKFSPFSTVTVPKYYSTYFNGSTDQLTVTTNSAFALGTGDFTIEAWVFLTTSTSTQCIVDLRTNATSTTGFFFGVVSSGIVQVWNQANALLSSAGVVGLNAWYHIALTRVGTAMSAYVNGVSVASSTNSTNWTDSNMRIGKSAGTEQIQGYLSNVRVIRGTAVYTTTFTPSTTPLTAVANTVLLTCQNNTFVDNSTNNFTITAATTTVKPLQVSPFTPTATTGLSYSPTTFGGSMYFDGTGDSLTPSSNPPLNLGTSNFTLEWWMYPTNISVTNQSLFFTGTGNLVVLMVSGTGVIQPGNYQNTGIVTPATGVTQNSWTHVAITRSGNVWNVYYNGVLAGTNSNYAFTPSTSSFVIGTGANGYYGYLSDYRLTVGTVIYNSNFYPGSTPATPTVTGPYSALTTSANTATSTLLLTGTSGGIIDQTRTVDLETVADAKLVNFSPYNGNYYSNYFDGTGDYITAPNSSAFYFGTGDFTVEFWMYITTAWTSNNGPGIGQKQGDSYGGWVIYRNTTVNTGSISIRLAGQSGSGNLDYVTSVTPTANKWQHWAVVRSGTTLTWYCDGVACGATTGVSVNVTDTTTGGTMNIGRAQTWGTDFTGHLSNVRVNKGTALYTTTFTPSTAPLTAVANTSLLTCQSNKFVDNSTNNFTITKNGDTVVKTQNPFQNNTGTSVYFDGTGDYLYAPYQPSNLFGSGDFTIEGWIYQSASQVSQSGIFSFYNGSAYFVLHNNATSYSNLLTVWVDNYSPGLRILTSSTTLVIGQWYHFAITREAGVWKLRVNGTQESTYTNSAEPTPSGSPLRVGYGNNAAFTGYITDFRITKYARYTTTFTPPTAPVKTN